MPHVYFNFRDHDELYVDDEGQDLEDLYAIRARAQLQAVDLAIAMAHDGWLLDNEQFVEAKGADGAIIVIVPVKPMTDATGAPSMPAIEYRRSRCTTFWVS